MFLTAASTQAVDLLGDAADYSITAPIDGNGDVAGPLSVFPGSAGSATLSVTNDPDFADSANRGILMFDLSPLLSLPGEVADAELRIYLADVGTTTLATTALYASSNLRAAPATGTGEYDDPSYSVAYEFAVPPVVQDESEGFYVVPVTSVVAAWRDALALDPANPFGHFRLQTGDPTNLLFNSFSSGNVSPDFAPLLSVTLVPEPSSLAALGVIGMGLLRRRERTR